VGVVVVAISLEHIEKLLAAIAPTSESSISLFRQDGALLVRYPRVDSAIAHNYGTNPVLRSLLDQKIARPARARSRIDGTERIFAGRSLSEFPVSALVSTTVTAALTGWRLEALFILTAGLLAAVAVAVMFALILRRLREGQNMTRRRLHAQQLQLNIALNNMTQGLCIFDRNGHLVICNDRYKQMYGIPSNAIGPGSTFKELVEEGARAGQFAGDVDEYVADILEKVRLGRSSEECEQTADGRWIRVVKQPIAGSGWVVTHDDITARRQAELERDRNREFLDRVLDNVPVTIVVKDAAYRRYLFINKAGEQLFGLPRNEIIGRMASECIGGPAADVIMENDDRLLRMNTDLLVEEQPFTIRGSVNYVTQRKMCIRANDGTPQYLVSVIEDVTDRRMTRQQLQAARRMEAVARLTGGIAHDFNNLLLIIIANLDMLIEDIRGNNSATEKAKIVLESSLRGADLTRQLLAFSRRQSLVPKQLQLNELIRTTAKFLQRTLGEDISVEVKLGEDLWQVAADEAQLEAALVNLAINARDAMPGGGKLIIEARNARLDVAYSEKHPEVTPGDFVVIEVTDNGTGMSSDVLAHAFEPFFTTKGPGRGTGLGLSTVFGFVQQSGGRINAFSELGRGSTFKLYFPRADGQARQVEDGKAEEVELKARSQDETVLVVEDDPTIRNMVAKQVEELGYRVLKAEAAAEALEVLEQHRVHVLFTDMVMPGNMNGKELAVSAVARDADLRVLFTSGFSGERELAGSQLDAGDILLTKPYRKHELARMIRQVLDRPGAESSVSRSKLCAVAMSSRPSS
jgi:PAS domain S-box-containing protein